MFGLRWAQKTKPCFVTLKTLFSSTAGQGFQNTKWLAVYKSGTRTMGRGHRNACVKTWDLGTRDEGLDDNKYGTRGREGRGRGGRQTQGRRGRGMRIIIAKVGGKCDISHFLVNTFW